MKEMPSFPVQKPDAEARMEKLLALLKEQKPNMLNQVFLAMENKPNSLNPVIVERLQKLSKAEKSVIQLRMNEIAKTRMQRIQKEERKNIRIDTSSAPSV